MSVNNACPGSLGHQHSSDPRDRLSQDKFFTLRPKPLERWLWSKRISAAAERVFWLHWSEGSRTHDWCSQMALQFVAQYCEVDASTVTRAYQSLKRLGLIRRTDPGRDPGNPYQQATAITEVLLPRDLLAALDSFPNRPRPIPAAPAVTHLTAESPESSDPVPPPKVRNPFADLDLKQQRERIKSLAASMSDAERLRWSRAICDTQPSMAFDENTQVSQETQGQIAAYLASRKPPKVEVSPPSQSTKTPAIRRLSLFDAARVRRGVSLIAEAKEATEIARQILWSVEEGALNKFPIALAINIALKKLRTREWSRPNRMPPNWMRTGERT